MSLQSPTASSPADPEADTAISTTFGTSSGTPADPFSTAYAASGLPAAALPFATAMYGQESSYGASDPSNPLRVTDATAAQPGYGMEPYSPQAYPGGKLQFGLAYLRSMAGAKGYDLTTPAGQVAAARAYNGGGDPDYVDHVEARLPGSYRTAMNGASDTPLQGNDQEAAQATAATFGSSAPTDTGFNPAPMPSLVAQNANDTSSIAPQRSTRQLLALAGGLLQGGTFASGLGKGLQDMNAEYDTESQQALSAWQAENMQALYAMRGNQFGATTALKGAQLTEKTGNDAGKLAVAGGTLQERIRNDLQTGNLKQAGLDLQAAQDNAKDGIAAVGAGANATRAGAAALNAGSAVVGAPAVPQITAPQVVGPQGAQAPASPPAPATPAAAPAPAGPAPQSPLQAALAAARTGGAMPAAGAPTGAPPAPAPAPAGPPAPAPATPPQAAPVANGAAASPWSGLKAGSLYDNLQGGMAARRPIQTNTAKDIVKEQEGDTGIIEGYNNADRVGTDQLQLLDQYRQQNPAAPLGTGFQGAFSKWLGTQTNNPLLADINKNQQQLTQANYPHGVGQLRVAELNTASALAPGSGMPFDASRHLIQQGLATRAFNRGVLNDRQAWIAANPGEAPEVGFDPMANDYISGHDAYSEDPKTQTITPNFTSGQDLLTFAKGHQGANGRYVHDNSDPETTQAVQAAFGPPPGGAPAAPATVAPAAPQNASGQASAPPVGASPSYAIPVRAISHLRSNPSLRGAFDQKYGAGSAAIVLGQ